MGRVGVVTGRDGFSRSSLVASAHFGMDDLCSKVFMIKSHLFLRLLVLLRRQLSRNNSKFTREVTLVAVPERVSRLPLQSARY
ncbi:hypothetical protein JOD43_003136 [Pullulanibacillus pueri]|nr:hypothetical protein [Pullulanibacillus pueri]